MGLYVDWLLFVLILVGFGFGFSLDFAGLVKDLANLCVEFLLGVRHVFRRLVGV